MLSNKILNITEEDVLNQTDLEQLAKWRNSISEQRISFFTKYGNDRTKFPHKVKIAYNYLMGFEKVIRRQIAEVRERRRVEFGWVSERNKKRERTLYAKFMEVAKREMNQDEYKRLLEIAKNELSKCDNVKN